MELNFGCIGQHSTAVREWSPESTPSSPLGMRVTNAKSGGDVLMSNVYRQNPDLVGFQSLAGGALLPVGDYPGG